MTDPEELLTQKFQKFMATANIILGSLVGCLICIPIITTSEGPRLPVLVLSGLAGAAIGFRRRSSRAFLYFSIICVLALSCLISFALFPDSN